MKLIIALATIALLSSCRYSSISDDLEAMKAKHPKGLIFQVSERDDYIIIDSDCVYQAHGHTNIPPTEIKLYCR